MLLSENKTVKIKIIDITAILSKNLVLFLIKAEIKLNIEVNIRVETIITIVFTLT